MSVIGHRDSELMLLGGSTSSGSDPDLPSLDMPEGGTHTRTDSQQRADPPLGPYEGVQEQVHQTPCRLSDSTVSPCASSWPGRR